MNDHGRDQSRDLLLVVARAPIAGFSKTRLGTAIGMDAAALLHRAFLEDISEAFFASDLVLNGIARGWAYTPPSFDFQQFVSTFTLTEVTSPATFVCQVGENFGDRLTNLLAWSTAHAFQRTVIMASDSPQLEPSIVGDAFVALVDHDLVIGRVLDGGYYLVGSRGYTEILSHVPMSTPDAAQALVDEAVKQGLSVAELPRDFDVDVAADLDLLVRCLMPAGKRAPATFRMLQSLGLIDKSPGRTTDSAAHCHDSSDASE
ncbi:TIGR04282 family arsenosugar biosynthesis glycosyltransferase [soil metagenome]